MPTCKPGYYWNGTACIKIVAGSNPYAIQPTIPKKPIPKESKENKEIKQLLEEGKKTLPKKEIPVKFPTPENKPFYGDISQAAQPDSLGENTAEFFDPTGVTSYDDAYRAKAEWDKSGNTLPTLEQSINMFGAVPLLGKLGKLKYISSAPDALKLAYKYFPWQEALNKGDAMKDIVEDNVQAPTFNPAFLEAGPKYKLGGQLNNNQNNAYIYNNGDPMEQLTEFNEGGTHNQNPLGGVPLGIGANGQPNLVEQGETKLNSKDYIFSDSLRLDKDVVSALNLSKTLVGKTFAEVSKKMNKPNSRRENDTIEANAISKDLDKLMKAQELFKQIEVEKKLAEIQSLDPNALGSLMGQGQAPMQPMEQLIDPQMIPQESVEQLPQEFDFGGWLNDNKQGVVGGLQTAAGLGAMFIPGAQGLGTNLMINGAKGIMGEVMQDNQPKLNTQGVYNAIPQQQGINFKYGGNMYEGGGGLVNTLGQVDIIPNSPTTAFMPTTENIEVVDTTPDVIDSNDDSYYNIPDVPQVFNNVLTNPSQLFSGNFGKDNSQAPNVYSNEYLTALQRAKENLKDKNVELDITQKPWEMALQGLPAAYNLGRGMFEKAQQLSLADYMQKPITAPKMNVDPQLAATREAYAGATAGLKNNMPGLGAYLSNRSSLANAEGQSKRDIYAGKENADNQLQLQTDVQNAQLLAQNLNNKMAVEQFNAQAKEAKKQLVGAGLVQGAQMGRASFDTQLQKQMLKLVAPDFTERWLELRGQKSKQ